MSVDPFLFYKVCPNVDVEYISTEPEGIYYCTLSPPPMKIIVAGSRGFNNKSLAFDKLDFFTASKPEVVVVCGMARGADLIGKAWAEERGHTVMCMPADWERDGRRAGYLRNVSMADMADALVAFWDGTSRGTAHMIREMKERSKPVRVVQYS